MDSIYLPVKYSCTGHINLKEYFIQYSTLHSTPIKAGFSRNKFSQIKLEPEEELLAATSIDLLTADPDKKFDIKDSSNKSNVILRTLKIQNAKKKLTPITKRYGSVTNRNTENKAIKLEGCDIVPGSEFAVTIRIYHPFEFNYDSSDAPNSYHNIRFSHEIIVLGSNSLADLRDKILCFNDSGIYTEVEDPCKPLETTRPAKEAYPSGFIFIDNTFYNDFRHPKCMDYSDVILQWAVKKNIHPLHVANMDSTRIDQLTPRFGYPYVYLHQGSCEHLIVFTDAYLLVNNGDLKLSNYPGYQSITRFYGRKCILCNWVLAEWMILGSDRLPFVRSFICSECLFRYLYKDGQRIGNFKIYQFYDRHLAM